MSREPVTAAALARVCEVSIGTITKHCREGLLQGKAQKVGRDWVIPYPVAEWFAKTYERYGTLRKSGPAR